MIASGFAQMNGRDQENSLKLRDILVLWPKPSSLDSIVVIHTLLMGSSTFASVFRSFGGHKIETIKSSITIIIFRFLFN
jgi:hypothetical protein